MDAARASRDAKRRVRNPRETDPGSPVVAAQSPRTSRSSQHRGGAQTAGDATGKQSGASGKTSARLEKPTPQPGHEKNGKKGRKQRQGREVGFAPTPRSSRSSENWSLQPQLGSAATTKKQPTSSDRKSAPESKQPQQEKTASKEWHEAGIERGNSTFHAGAPSLRSSPQSENWSLEPQLGSRATEMQPRPPGKNICLFQQGTPTTRNKSRSGNGARRQRAADKSLAGEKGPATGAVAESAAGADRGKKGVDITIGPRP